MMLPSMGAFFKAGRAQSDRIDTNLPVEVSVVTPCLNDANSRGFCVAEAVNAFRASGLSGEVIVADNGSSDGSMQIAEEHCARVVRGGAQVWLGAARRHRRCRRPTHHERCGPELRFQRSPEIR